ncbi:unnamed protein product [Periconia digitata]|uniref:Uncharacterized protein n=1 Tax=Periconia digitata TaxID=1303443 RepID=A0A9W4U901_9PLEO|nr:unnamed protein product [Periconia digitata]
MKAASEAEHLKSSIPTRDRGGERRAYVLCRAQPTLSSGSALPTIQPLRIM